MQSIAEDSELHADAFIDRLNGKLTLLASRPEMGRRRNDVLAGLHSFPFARYVIFHFPLSDGVDVVRILHSARDTDAQFRKGK